MILLKNKDKKANIKIGNNIEIKDGNDFPFDLTLYGKSTQATRSGKNLFTKQGNATPKTDTTFWGGITNTTPESDGWCKVSVDNTNGTELAFANQMTKRNTIDKLEVNTMYSILIEVRNLIVSGSGNISPILQLCETTQNSVWQSRQEYDLTVLPKTSKMVFQKLTKANFDNSIYDFRNYVSIPKGYKVEFEYRLMVVKGSYTLDTIGEYEPYGVMPSPDYPSPIESVGRKNLFNKDNANIIDTYVIGSGNGVLPSDGGTENKCVYIPCKQNTTYTIQKMIGKRFGVAYTYETPAQGVMAYNRVINNSVASITITTDSSAKYLVVYLRNGNISGEITLQQALDSLQIEQGTVATDYVPYEHTEISATVTGKNLFDGTGWRTVQSGNGFPKPATGATIVSSDANNISFTSKQSTYAGVESGFIKVKANETYMFSAKFTTPTNRFFITQYDENKIRISTLNYENVTTLQNTSFTTTNDGNITIAFTNTTNEQTTYKIENIQLEKSSVATEYEEYKSNSLTIDLQGNELCSLPRGTKDEVNITNGEALLIKRVGKIVLDGSESWSDFSVGDTNFRCQCDVALPNILTPPTNPAQLFSNYFKSINRDNVYAKTEIGIAQYGSTLGKVFICAPNTILSEQTLASWKTWLSTHNTEVYYALAEPETINLGTVEMPHTYEGVSNITNSADTEMVVKYYKKFEFDKILRSGYNIDEQEYEIAKKQMANGKRKKILSSYVDCIIKIDLGLLDNKTYQEYKEQLEDGEYEYWSYKYNQYKKANFILTKPSITTEYAYDDEIGIDDMEITLEKSSDVS